MKKYLVILILLAVLIYGCAQQTTPQKQTQTKDNANQPDFTPPSESYSVAVEIKDFAFNPATITVQKGTTVTWIQKDSTRHTATSDEGIFDSGLLSLDQSWSYTFNEAGTFKYHCTPHPNMKGTIVVE